MNRTQKITLAASAFVVAGLVALALPAVTSVTVPEEPNVVDMLPVTGSQPEAAADPADLPETEQPLTELPAWAQTGTLWLVYPDDLRCQGTEGCPNDYRAAFGEPGETLPPGVEYYDPARHDYNRETNTGMVFPAVEEQ
ncbi:hypothetical protein [Microbacterium aurantiacum]|uniref:hypothetical protein n=1 Tax=Microbacterium aurantiacum TaxID=162393 RepID=UPI003F496624